MDWKKAQGGGNAIYVEAACFYDNFFSIALELPAG